MSKVIIIGGGASGLMAAYSSATQGNEVLLLEKNEKIGKKIYITGKGRCNLTNNSDIETHLNNTIRGSRFMNGAIRRLTPQSTMEMFEPYVALKTEHGNRVFPVSDKSSDIISALNKMLVNAGVEIGLNTQVKDIKKQGDIFNILCNNNTIYQAYSVLIATGGGTPCFFDNMAYMNECGVAVFLTCSVEVICHRLMIAKVKRPLVEGCTPEELHQKVTTMLQQRLPYYEQAQYTFQADEYEKATALALATEQLREISE